jgi:aryl-alcohol dehydrogenase-like predicted oxidoreductase
MQQRRLGKLGPEVSALGLGCMAMSEFYGSSDDNTSIKVILSALDQGITLLDTADTYGHGHNEELIAKALKQWRGGRVFIASKFGIVRVKGEYRRSICGRPDYVRQCVEGSLKRLGREVIDLYYVHRIDESVPIEDTVGALADLVRTGKIRYIGLSEPSTETLRRAHAVHPVTAVQSEYSLWSRDVETMILPFIRELGVGFVAYSPLGRGALTGKLDRKVLSGQGDLRQFLPRFSDANLQVNLQLTQNLVTLAKTKGITPAQAALAWLLAKGDDIVPIPGTRHLQYLSENIQAAQVVLTDEQIRMLEAVFVPGAIQGDRYTAEGMAGVNK